MSAKRRLLVFPAAGLVAALMWTTVGSFSTAAGQESPAPRFERAHAGRNAPDFTEPIYMLIIGGDARNGNPENQGVDSIHILGIDPVKLEASIVGLPRDSYIPSPGGGSAKLTDIGRRSGIRGVIQAVENYSKCDFDYYMATAFEGFRGQAGNREGGLVNQMGGITHRVEKSLSGLNPVPVPKGRQKLSGARALSYARNRKEVAGGDFGRSENQGKLMISALREARADFRSNPGTALRNLAVLRRNVRMDIGLKEGLQLGLMAMRIKPGDVDNIVVAGEIGTAGSASIVRITQRGRDQLADVCADGLLDQS